MKYIWIIMLMLADVVWWVATVRDIKTTLAMNKKISNLWNMWHGKKDIAWADFEFYTMTCVFTHLAALFLISFAKWVSQYVTIG